MYAAKAWLRSANATRQVVNDLHRTIAKEMYETIGVMSKVLESHVTKWSPAFQHPLASI